MRVLFNCHVPFSLAHGGAQIQIEETMRALNGIGVETEPLRWWDDRQKGDILHHVARVPTTLVRIAQNRGMKVVTSELLTGQGSRSGWRLTAQGFAQRVMHRFGPGFVMQHFQWESYQLVDACLVLTPWEGELLVRLYNTPREKIHVVPNGVEAAFFESPAVKRGQWLVCTATITGRKRVLELAEAAIVARTPLWIIGKPYGPDDAYSQRFLQLARSQPDLVRFEGPIQDRARLAIAYREARGFVLLSTMESLSISALEASACECPLLLSDLAWARTTFREHASYCSVSGSTAQTAGCLRRFYDAAPSLKPPPKPLSWEDVARQIKNVYERVLNTSP